MSPNHLEMHFPESLYKKDSPCLVHALIIPQKKSVLAGWIWHSSDKKVNNFGKQFLAQSTFGVILDLKGANVWKNSSEKNIY